MKVVIHGYIENLWAKRLHTYAQTLEIMGYIVLPEKIVVAINKHDSYIQRDGGE